MTHVFNDHDTNTIDHLYYYRHYMWITRNYRNVFAINTDSMCPCFVVTWAVPSILSSIKAFRASRDFRDARHLGGLGQNKGVKVTD